MNEKEIRNRMNGAIEALTKEFSGLRSGRATPALVEPLQVEAYGGHMSLKELASVSIPEPRQVAISVWDQSLVKSVEKAISDADMGLNPMSEGNVVRVNLPQLTEERRKELSKIAGKYAENSRIHIRNVRRDAIDELRKAEKKGDIAQDELHKGQDKVQKLTDEFVGKIDSMLAQKEEDIMSV